jgi:division protein CdvB (Snf7/Vps24/ESCRT-III family)
MRARVSALKNKKRPVAGKMNGKLEALSKRLAKVEDEIATIRRELAKVLEPSAPQKQKTPKRDVLSDLWADKTLLQQAFEKLFKELSIEGKPIPAEELQKLMGEIGLEPNELSQAITAAREE